MVSTLGLMALVAGPTAAAERRFTLMPTGGSHISTLQAFPQDEWLLANYSVQDPNHFYDTGFSRDYVNIAEDRISLRIDRKDRPPNNHTGAELRLRGPRGYGRYEAVMKPARGSGLVSAFFTWTGGQRGTPHDEIDIEFLGKDTTIVSFNLYADGHRLTPSKRVQLPFDAADSFNLYAFEWTPEAVHWYVNDARVFSVYAYERTLPSHPGIVMASIWTGSRAQWAWHGKPDFVDGTTAEFKCISFRALGDMQAEQCSDTFMPD